MTNLRLTRYHDVVAETLGLSRPEPPKPSPFDEIWPRYVVLFDRHNQLLSWWDAGQDVKDKCRLHFSIAGPLGASIEVEFENPDALIREVAGGYLKLYDVKQLIEATKQEVPNGVSSS